MDSPGAEVTAPAAWRHRSEADFEPPVGTVCGECASSRVVPCTTPEPDPTSPCGFVYRWEGDIFPTSLHCFWLAEEHGPDLSLDQAHPHQPTLCLRCHHAVERGMKLLALLGPDGRGGYRYFTGTDREDVRKRMDEARRARDRKTSSTPRGGERVRDLVVRYQRDVDPVRNRWKTVKNNAQVARDHIVPTLGSGDIRAAQAIAGHQSVTTTLDTYGTEADAARKRGAEAFDRMMGREAK